MGQERKPMAINITHNEPVRPSKVSEVNYP